MPGTQNGTPKIVLRDILDSDLNELFYFHSDVAANHMAAFIGRDPHDRAAFDAHWKKIRSDGITLLQAIAFNDEIVGYVGSFIMDDRRNAMYWIGKRFWGRGIATAALNEFLKIEKTRPLYASVAMDNIGSQRVLEKCSFKQVGREKVFAKGRGKEIEEVFFSLEQ